MDARGLSQRAPLIGILAPVLWFAGVTVSEGGGTPDDDATADQILAFFREETTALLLGGVLFMAGTLAFALLVTVLRGRMRSAGASDDAAALMFGSGLIGAAFLAATWAPQLGVAIAIEDMGASIEPATAESAWHMGTGFFVLGELFVAVFLFAVAAAALKTRMLPAWLAWAAIVLGLVALVPPIGWAAIIFGLPLWILVTVALLMMKTSTPAAPPA